MQHATDRTIRCAMANMGHTALAEMVLHLHTWIKPECWEEWVMTYGVGELERKEVFPSVGRDSFGAPIYYPGCADVLKSMLRLAYAEVN